MGQAGSSRTKRRRGRLHHKNTKLHSLKIQIIVKYKFVKHDNKHTHAKTWVKYDLPDSQKVGYGISHHFSMVWTRQYGMAMVPLAWYLWYGIQACFTMCGVVGRLHHWHQIYMRLHIRGAGMGLIGKQIKHKFTNSNRNTNTFKHIKCTCTNKQELLVKIHHW